MRICECFKSIQGEGLMMGVPTFFVRTVGCNLSCAWCDTQYSMDGGKEMSLQEIMDAVGDSPHVCVTGGEPMLQPDMPELLRMMVAAGKQVVLETNGATDLSQVPDDPLIMISMDIKCPSSGMTSRMLKSNLGYLSRKDQLKFIVADDVDFDFAVEFLKENPYPTLNTTLDKGRVQQVITNFVTNAVKYTREGHIKVGYRKQDEGLYIYCEDTGAGIPKDKQASVFERFVKLNDFVQGTGLGLSICKTIAERCNGKIGVFSEGEGKGSTFWLWIPCELNKD